jgi:hypothetical protein
MFRPALRLTQPPVHWVPGVLSPGLKCGRAVTLTTHPYLVPSLIMSRSNTSSPQAPPWCVMGQLFNLKGRYHSAVINPTVDKAAQQGRHSIKTDVNYVYLYFAKYRPVVSNLFSLSTPWPNKEFS